MAIRRYTRIHLVVLDSVGIGAAPDAALFGDEGCDTLGHIAAHGLCIPWLEKLGLGSIRPLQGLSGNPPQQGYATKLMEHSAGKDTLTGHWELMGLVTETPFPVYEQGFPPALVAKMETISGRRVLCNRPYSGTAVIDDYAAQQRETGGLIVYTSADSVLQIAAHEEVIPLAELYRICAEIRAITLEPLYLVGRIIARPFIGVPGRYQRTPNRHDYALHPFGHTALNYLSEDSQTQVIAIGKINDIFDGSGITHAIATRGNMDGIDQLLDVMRQDFYGLSFLNLVDFDAMYGHRRDVSGYAKALEDFDARLPQVLNALRPDDLLLITADHGNDPTFTGTDHTREYVPLLAYSPAMRRGGLLPDGNFGDVGATICENFNAKLPKNGVSFLQRLSDSSI